MRRQYICSLLREISIAGCWSKLGPCHNRKKNYCQRTGYSIKLTCIQTVDGLFVCERRLPEVENCIVLEPEAAGQDINVIMIHPEDRDDFQLGLLKVCSPGRWKEELARSARNLNGKELSQNCKHRGDSLLHLFTDISARKQAGTEAAISSTNLLN